MPPGRRTLPLVAAAVALILGAGAAPAAAQGNTCNEDITPTYTGRCGPEFARPGWGDAGGWTNPEQYETIQLADVDGDGADELLARTPAGIAVEVFDKKLGQWRPQTTATAQSPNTPVILTEFANRPPLTIANPKPPKTFWTLPQYYDTIQTADIDADNREEIIARSTDGMIVFDFTPSGPGKGSWKQLSTSGPFADPDWAYPYYYATIQTGDFDGDGGAELFARGRQGIAMLWWDGKSWNEWNNLDYLTDADGGKSPAYYTSLQVANLTGDKRQELVGRTKQGIAAFRLRYLDNTPIGRLSETFSDQQRDPDCPFGSGKQCFGSGPAYYKTIQFADVDGDGRDELLGRASDGLRVRRYRADSPEPWGALPTLTGLSDANGYDKQQYWETIQAADINGDGRAEVLARDKDGLNAWTYDPGKKAWSKLAPKTPLALADDPWGSDRSYYSTIQTGDVNGDGRADVVAHGPYGIRTWFYDRRGTGGWERYLAPGYRDFATADQRAAFDELNAQAQGAKIAGLGSNVRDVWSGENAPKQSDLDALQKLVQDIGNCTKKVPKQLPTHYGSCTPPAGAKFAATAWTDVVNEILAEIYWATQVDDHFEEINDMRKSLYISENAELPAIGSDLQLTAAKDASAEFNTNEVFSGIFGIAGALVGAIPGAGELAAIPLEMASEAESMVPSASGSLTDEFDGTYADLKNKFAQGASEATKAIEVQSQEVRQDGGLLATVGELRASGAWNLDSVGMISVGQLGFATSIYKTLLPALWARYIISDCDRGGPQYCKSPSPGPWMTGDATNFTAIGRPAKPDGKTAPCWEDLVGDIRCDYSDPPEPLAGLLWGKISTGCDYQPPNSKTAWTFGCNLGIDPGVTIPLPVYLSATDQWNFTTYRGSFWVFPPGASGVAGDGTVRLSGTMRSPRRLRLARARITVNRLLFDRGGSGELVHNRSGAELAPLTLSHRPRGKVVRRVYASKSGRGPVTRLRLWRSGRRSLSFSVRIRGTALELPAVCSGTRPGVDIASEPIPLHTRLRIDDGPRRPVAISLSHYWECRRNRVGAVHRLVLHRPEVRRSNRSLAIAVRGPRRVGAGSRATYRIKLSNRRRTTAHEVVVRADMTRAFRVLRARGARHTAGNNVVWRVPALGAGRSRSFRLRVRARPSAAGRQCPRATATAADTRASRARTCTRIRR